MVAGDFFLARTYAANDIRSNQLKGDSAELSVPALPIILSGKPADLAFHDRGCVQRPQTYQPEIGALGHTPLQTRFPVPGQQILGHDGISRHSDATCFAAPAQGID
jgi:hypothetical protein